jgi:hypothetical protein
VPRLVVLKILVDLALHDRSHKAAAEGASETAAVVVVVDN